MIVDFLFLIEHEDREGAAVRRIVNSLSNYGYVSVVMSTEFHAHRYREYKPRSVVVPYSINEKQWPIKYFRSRFDLTVKFMSLNWEQLLSKANREFKKPKTYAIKNYFSHLAWDENFKSFLVESGVNEERISVIGNPLQQLLREDLVVSKENSMKLYEDFSIPNSTEILFFPMNYGWAFASDKTIKAKIRMGYDEDVAWEYRRYSQECLDRFVYFIKDLSEVSTDKIIVIRPHPSISIEQYEEVFKTLDVEIPVNVIITKKYTIKEWISISVLVASSWSTSVWDAIQVGKLGFLFTPIPRPDWLDTDWNNLVPNISEVNELMTVVKDGSLSLHDGDIIDDITLWLIDSLNNAPVCKFQYTLCSGDFLYGFRSFFRELCMEKLRGRFIGGGLKRDYFVPYLTESLIK